MAAYMKLGDIKGQTAADAPGDAASDAFALGPDAAEQHKDHKNWINVASCNMGGHRSGDGDDATGAFANDTATAAEPYLQIELKEVLVTGWQTSPGDAGGSEWIELDTFSFDGATGAGPSPTGHYTQMIWADTRTSVDQPNQPSWGLDRIDESPSGGGTGKVSVHDISVTRQCDDAGGVNALLGDGSVRGSATRVRSSPTPTGSPVACTSRRATCPARVTTPSAAFSSPPTPACTTTAARSPAAARGGSTGSTSATLRSARTPRPTRASICSSSGCPDRARSAQPARPRESGNPGPGARLLGFPLARE